jgi:hypothetical protein
VIHTILNPSFPISGHIAFLPIRESGFSYAMLISLRISALAIAATLWLFSDFNRIFWQAVELRLPLGLIAIISLAQSNARTIRRRVDSVLLAQRARGIRTQGNVVVRARALVAVVLPVVVTALVEGEQRGALLKNRGFGSGPLSFEAKSRLGWSLVGDISVVFMATVVSLLIV